MNQLTRYRTEPEAQCGPLPRGAVYSGSSWRSPTQHKVLAYRSRSFHGELRVGARSGPGGPKIKNMGRGAL